MFLHMGGDTQEIPYKIYSMQMHVKFAHNCNIYVYRFTHTAIYIECSSTSVLQLSILANDLSGYTL